MDAGFIIKRALTRIPLLLAWFLFLAMMGAGRLPEEKFELGEERSTGLVVLSGSSKENLAIGIGHPGAFDFTGLPVCNLNSVLFWSQKWPVFSKVAYLFPLSQSG